MIGVSMCSVRQGAWFGFLSYPELGRVFGKPIGESNDAGPDDALPHGAVLAQQEDIVLNAAL